MSSLTSPPSSRACTTPPMRPRARSARYKPCLAARVIPTCRSSCGSCPMRPAPCGCLPTTSSATPSRCCVAVKEISDERQGSSVDGCAAAVGWLRLQPVDEFLHLERYGYGEDRAPGSGARDHQRSYHSGRDRPARDRAQDRTEPAQCRGVRSLGSAPGGHHPPGV